ncbi:MAG: hypothetical protein IJP31_07850 [Lachnospiraceae bacterium]|nr:hypothetical protein [Lachnospiraceae bacterium]
MSKKRIRAGLAVFVLLANLVYGYTGQEKVVMAADVSKEEQVLINIADQLPRGGEAQLIEELMFGEEETAAGTWQEIGDIEDGQETDSNRQADAEVAVKPVVEAEAEVKPAAEAEVEVKTVVEAEDVAVEEILRIATVGSLNEELLKAAEPYLLRQGYGLEIISCEDYETPNTLLISGEVDANFFQHTAYLERYNLEKNTQLSSFGAVYYEPLGVYPGEIASLEELTAGSRIAVPANPTGYARALFLLKQEGLLELATDADLLAVWEDVTANPHELELVAMEDEELAASLTEMDMVIFSTSQALAGAMDPAGFLALEAEDSLAARSLSQILAVNGKETGKRDAGEVQTTVEEADGEKAQTTDAGESGSDQLMPEGGQDSASGLQLLLEVLRSEEIKEVVSKQYHSSIIILE